MQFLLDTNIVSDLVRHPQGAVAKRIRKVGEDRVCTSVVVAGELRYGARKRGSDKLTSQLEKILKPLPVLAMVPAVSETYGSLRTHLEKVGTPIGANDLWIAAHALHHGCTLVTDNEREFARVPDLDLENWLR